MHKFAMDNQLYRIHLGLAGAGSVSYHIEGTASALSEYENLKDVVNTGIERGMYWYEYAGDVGTTYVKVKDISHITISKEY